MGAELPRRFPIFPLPNVVLFPEVRLPLHIFEPRYRAMTAAALAGERCLGMVLLRPGADAALARAPIFDVGCLGTIAESRRLTDGRFHMILRGERRFRIAREESGAEPYRTVVAELLPDAPFTELPPTLRGELERERARLEQMVLEIARHSVPAALERFSEQMRLLDPVAFVHALAFGLDTSPLEKQGLLEAPDALARCRMLIQLLEFRRAEGRLPESPRGVN
jgi:Lon protease-like protein